MQLTHEQLIHAVVASVASRLPTEDKATLDHARFVHGAGKTDRDPLCGRKSRRKLSVPKCLIGWTRAAASRAWVTCAA